MMDPENSFMKNGPEGTFGHTGFTGTSICVVPSKGVSVILLINRQQMGLIGDKEYYNVNPIRAQIFKAVMDFYK
jgi:CubicO group peptidase (beta-lactamase class C family)